MPDQPDRRTLFPDPADAPSPAAVRPADPASAPVWLQRISLFILVIFCIYLGVIVTILPWLSAVWDHNLFFTSHPALWSVLRRGPTRGVISGLGLLDIWIGISEAVNYRDTPKQNGKPSTQDAS